jgi:hypothetical protein
VLLGAGLVQDFVNVEPTVDAVGDHALARFEV